jgi:hypothetical protein
MTECTCDGWKKSNKQIESAQMLAWTHGMIYTGDIMNFCPWCGKKLDRGYPKERVDLSKHYQPVDVDDYTPTDEGDK